MPTVLVVCTALTGLTTNAGFCEAWRDDIAILRSPVGYTPEAGCVSRRDPVPRGGGMPDARDRPRSKTRLENSIDCPLRLLSALPSALGPEMT